MITRSAITGRFVAVAEALKDPGHTVQAVRYPYVEGDVLVIGPECFASADRGTICWRGANYVLLDDDGAPNDG